MTHLSSLIGGGGGIRMVIPIPLSREWRAPGNGVLIARLMAPGGGGARADKNKGCATGGYSGQWGWFCARIEAGEVILFEVGCSGAGASANASNGLDGGDTVCVFRGVTYTVRGGRGGLYLPPGASLDIPLCADLDPCFAGGARGVQPGVCATGATGGAGVDILGIGQCRSASVARSGGGGSVWASSGPDGGGFWGQASACPSYGAAPDWGGNGLVLDISQGEWGVPFLGGAGGNAGYSVGTGGSGDPGLCGGNGGGGGAGANGRMQTTTNNQKGGNGGSGGPGGGGGAGGTGAAGNSTLPGAQTGGIGGMGGFGAGGGAGGLGGDHYNTGADADSGNGGPGGMGYAAVEFFLDAP